MGDVYNLGELDGLKTKVLYTGSASSVNTYDLEDSINNYKMLLVMFGATSPGYPLYNKMSRIIDIDEIGVATNTAEFRIIQHNGGSSPNYYSIQFYFPSDTTFKVTTVKQNGWTNSRIYKIIGIY